MSVLSRRIKLSFVGWISRLKSYRGEWTGRVACFTLNGATRRQVMSQPLFYMGCSGGVPRWNNHQLLKNSDDFFEIKSERFVTLRRGEVWLLLRVAIDENFVIFLQQNSGFWGKTKKYFSPLLGCNESHFHLLKGSPLVYDFLVCFCGIWVICKSFNDTLKSCCEQHQRSWTTRLLYTHF